MNLLFLTYANSPTAPLEALSREDDAVYEMLSRRYQQQHFALQREAHADMDKIARYLIRFREELEVFSFSGHAGRDRLRLEGQDANAEGIARLLELCPRLKLVLLNGCSTEGQVRRLLQLENRPAVIATSAPVGDMQACQFAISFFQALSEEFLPVEEAFRIGLAAAQAVAKGPLQVEPGRQLATGEESHEERPLWGLFTADETGERERWMLPLGQAAEPGQPASQPNELLIGALMDSLEPFDPEVAQVKAEEQQRSSAFYFTESTDTLLPRKHHIIIRSYPSPISSHLKLLFAPRRQGEEGEVFYDEFNLPRLQRLAQVYLSAVELPAFFLLGQLWDRLLLEQGPPPPEDLLPVIRRFLLAQAEERRTRLQFQLVPAVFAFLEGNGEGPFFGELAGRMEHFTVDSAYYHACQTLESLHKRLAARQFRPAGDPQLAPSCLVAEQGVAEALRVLSFLANYALISIRNIDVLCNRHFMEPHYIHKVVRLEINLVYQDAAPVLDVEDHTSFLHNYSVLVRPKGKGKDSFLNLTPFIFDENAFIPKAQARKDNLKLYYFSHYDGLKDELVFKHVDNMANPPLRVSNQANQGPLKHLRDQIEAFSHLLFNRPLREL
ncbi:MAG: hypothetical protein H6559_00255 [Lewinellaceae bacterium]|nr:hypothetical protein [Lewinellaceae bacterium]